MTISVHAFTETELEAVDEIIKAAYNFSQQRGLSHMYKGKHVQRSRHTMLYGQASLGFG